MSPIRVCYFGTYRGEYSRNRILIEGLRAAGAEVAECHANLWTSIDDRVNLTSGGWLSPKFWLRVAKAYCQLIFRYFKTPPYDVLVVGYPGQFDIFLARLLNFFRGNKKICWDILMSIYLVAVERELDKSSKLTVRMLRTIEGLACKIPDMLILESQEYVDWFVQTHKAKPSKFRLVPLGANPPGQISMNQQLDRGETNDIRVLYWGGFLRSHGVDCMIKAAHLLQDHGNIRFEFVGTGPELEKMVQLSKDLHIKNVSFSGFLPNEELAAKITDADICLGIFGTTQQSYMTIQNKIHECLSMGKPLISGTSPLVFRTFQSGKEIFLCEREPKCLSQAILEVASSQDLRDVLSTNGYAKYEACFKPKKIGEVFKRHLEELALNG